jgi:hypothetical protein
VCRGGRRTLVTGHGIALLFVAKLGLSPDSDITRLDFRVFRKYPT